jgi:hypothetical protein
LTPISLLELLACGFAWLPTDQQIIVIMTGIQSPHEPFIGSADSVPALVVLISNTYDA